MSRTKWSDPAEALYHELRFNDDLELVVKTTARTGFCPLPPNEELDPASIKAKAHLAEARSHALHRFTRQFNKPLSKVEGAQVDPGKPSAVADAAVGDMLARAAAYEREDEQLRCAIRVLNADLDGIEQRGEGRRSVRLTNLGTLGAGTAGLALVEGIASAAFLFSSGHPGGWIGTGTLAAIYGVGNTLGAYLLGDHLLRRSASRSAMLARIVGASALVPTVVALNSAFGLLRIAGPDGLDGIITGLQNGAPLINIERLELVLLRFDVIGVVLLGPALFAWMTAKWHKARNPNPCIDRIERALARLECKRKKLRNAFEADIEDRAEEAHGALDNAQEDAAVRVEAAKHALLSMREALSEFEASELARTCAHEGAVNLFRARLAARIERRLLPNWVHGAADFSRDAPKVTPSEGLRRKVEILDRLLDRFHPAVAAARACLEQTRRAVLGLASVAARAGDFIAGDRTPAPPMPPLVINPAE